MKTILLVEDDEGNGMLIAQLISQETSYHVLVTRDCHEARRIIFAIKPDLFIIDYRLPFMNGIELYDLLHAHKELQHIPAILISATFRYKIAQQLEERDLFFLNKPFELQEFIEAIENVLAASSSLSLSSACSS
jgi:CheY-like chemotaxis protein